MRRLLLTLMLVLPALPMGVADGQIIRTGRFQLREPQLWVSGGVGLQEGFTVFDGTTGSRWQFSDTEQFGVTIERSVRSGVTLGLRGSHARVPLRHSTLEGSGGVEADANVSQAFAQVHVVSGRDFHTVLEAGAGATFYSGFKSRGAGGGTLAPSSDTDLAFVLGFGFGYSFSRSFQVDVVRDVGTSRHQKTGLAAGERRSARIEATRLVARFGLGS